MNYDEVLRWWCGCKPLNISRKLLEKLIQESDPLSTHVEVRVRPGTTVWVPKDALR